MISWSTSGSLAIFISLRYMRLPNVSFGVYSVPLVFSLDANVPRIFWFHRSSGGRPYLVSLYISSASVSLFVHPLSSFPHMSYLSVSWFQLLLCPFFFFYYPFSIFFFRLVSNSILSTHLWAPVKVRVSVPRAMKVGIIWQENFPLKHSGRGLQNVTTCPACHYTDYFRLDWWICLY